MVNTAKLLAWHESEKMLARFDESIKKLFEEYAIDYARVFAISSNVFYQNYALFVQKDQVLLASLLAQKAKHEVSYNDPKWYNNIIFDEESLNFLSKLFPEKSIKTENVAMKPVQAYGDDLLIELQKKFA